MCVHNYDDDFFEELSEEEIKKREEDRRLKFRESLKGEKLEIALEDDFKQAFALAYNFTSREWSRPEYWCVYCGKDFLMATDAHALAKIKANVPEILVGRHVVNYDKEGVFLAKEYPPVFANGRAQELLDKARTGEAIRKTLIKDGLDRFFVQYPDDLRFVQIEGGPVLQKVFLECALAAIEDDEEFTVWYVPGSKVEPLLIEGKRIECLILPVRVD